VWQKAMKRIIFFCLISAASGILLAGRITTPLAVSSVSTAQEPTREPLIPAPNASPDYGQANFPGSPAMPSPVPAMNPAGDEDLTPEERVNVSVYEHVNRSVASIATKGRRGDSFMLVEVPWKGEGSGSVITRTGYVLTNFHVVDGADQITVTLFDGKDYPARLVGKDPVNDVAVVKIEAPPEVLFPVTFGDSSRLRVGQKVFAIGNPFGMERTLSTGIVSSVNREMPSRQEARTVKQVIQIDAAINPGNSGGPLLDSHGRVIGMTWAIASKTGESAGVGFAIPINTIARVVPQLLKNGRVIRPEVGISKVYPTEAGLVIAVLDPGGPAQQAGLQGFKIVTQRKRQGPFVYEYKAVDRSAADTIVAVDGQPTKTPDAFLTAIDSKQPGDQVVITVIRRGQQYNVSVRLGGGE
jgi:S1-C subfamily serine protease